MLTWLDSEIALREEKPFEEKLVGDLLRKVSLSLSLTNKYIDQLSNMRNISALTTNKDLNKLGYIDSIFKIATGYS